MTEDPLGIDNERRQRNEALAGKTMFNGGVNPSANLALPGRILAITQETEY